MRTNLYKVMTRCFSSKSSMKAGVSLIAVLLFMLIATIAATATWKWITSEGFSSQSRMLKREAYQSSMAGIENARTWMTFHANDVGALIKQYLDDPNHKPINLDKRLRSIQRAGQDYHVWLTGVNTEEGTYKVKILSSGESRNNARHTEVAILNVDGLYRVSIPGQVAKKHVDFKFNYYGGSTHTEGHSHVYSMMINGNFEGSNPLYTESDLIVTGNVVMTGSSMGTDGTACIGGNLDGNNGVFGNDFYVGGNASHFTFPTASEAKNVVACPSGQNCPTYEVRGNVYIEGNLDNGPQNQEFHESLTLNGVWTTNFSAHKASVGKNLCLGPNGQVYFSAPPQSDRKFVVGKHVYSKSSQSIGAAETVMRGAASRGNVEHYDYIHLGTSADAKVYMSGAKDASAYQTQYRNLAANQGKDASGSTYKPYPSGKPDLVANVYVSDQYFLDFAPPTVEYKKRASAGATHNYFINDTLFTDNSSYEDGVIMDEYYRSYSSHVCTGTNANTNFGGTEGSHLIRFPSCYIYPWFKSNGTVSHSVPSTQPTEIQCAESVRDYCLNILGSETTGCDGSKYKIDDILVTAYSKFEGKANMGCTIAAWDDNFSTNLNACYKNNTATQELIDKNLYNGYQVVKINYSEKKDPQTPLEGKFIIIVENELGNIGLPPTTKDSYVLLYLKEGSATTSSIQPAVTGSNAIYNYFIYTKKNMGSVLFNNEVFSGSIYASSEQCAKARDFKARKLEFNDDLISDLASSSVICDAASETETTCGSTSSGSTITITEDDDIVDGRDNYYIAMAPQLGVTLESQNKSSESLPPLKQDATKEDLDSSFIILPRVIYLPQDPYGGLRDYFNVIPLNGSHLQKSNVTLSSCAGISGTSGSLANYNGTKLYEASHGDLEKGTYKCIAQASGYSNVPFWVIVGNKGRTAPAIHFTNPSQAIGESGNVTVSVAVPAHPAQAIDLNVYCPENLPAGWSYGQATGGPAYTRNGSICTFHLNAATAASNVDLFKVTTQNVTSGTIKFELLSGEGYIPESPLQADVHIASVATLRRIPATQTDIDAYCQAHSSACPQTESERSDWPDCNTSDLWVSPTGTSFIEDYKNNVWTVMVGGSGTLSLTDRAPGKDKCVVIIPSQSYNIATLNAGQTYELKATAKAKISTLHIVFQGVESGKNPIVNVKVAGHSLTTCAYNDNASTHSCNVSVYSGELVSLSIDKNMSANEDFSYWNCEGASCPTDFHINSVSYDPFYVSDNGTTVYVVFGVQDQHCFFDEFKQGSVTCSVTNTEYCIDRCGKNVVGAAPVGPDQHCTDISITNSDYTNAKWHLIEGKINEIKYNVEKSISVEKGKSVKVLSTVEAGRTGTLKALAQLPRAASSGGASKDNVKNSGFMLRSNNTGTSYLMLNVYADNANKVMAQVCTVNGADASSCISDELRRNGNPLRISQSNMVMITASITNDDKLVVSAFDDDYYGSPRAYSNTFDLSNLSSSFRSVTNQYVGFRMADANFKIFGIGWISDEYASECHDTPPIVKCSFAARAVDGVVPVEQNVVPWVGHSGWFDSHEYSCEKKFYYYNGTDACGGTDAEGVYSCDAGYYNFSRDGAGQHGYGANVKTAKAGMKCTLGGQAGMWTADPEPSSEDESAGEQWRAHCGWFWTGEMSMCSEHAVLYSGERVLAAGEEWVTAFSGTGPAETSVNLRGATLKISAENGDGNEIEVWLYSAAQEHSHEDDYSSRSVTMNGNTGSFDVVETFAGETRGFDPQRVKQIAFKNKGGTPVTIKTVNSVCSQAVGVESCSATLDGNTWRIEAVIANEQNVEQYQVLVTRTKDGTAENSTAVNWTSSVTHNSSNSVLFDYEDSPFLHQGERYDFSVVVTSDASDPSKTVTGNCSVSPQVLGSVTCNTSLSKNVGYVGQNPPQLRFTLSGCPAGGCPYEIRYKNEKIDECPTSGTTTCETTVNKTASGTLASTDVGQTYQYSVVSPAGSSVPFTCPEREFTVQNQSSLSLTCPDDITGQNPANAIIFTPTVTGCGTDGCSYTISSATNGGSGSGYSGSGSLWFYNANGEETVTHTLTMTNSDGASDNCTFDVTYGVALSGDATFACGFDKNGSITTAPAGYQWSNFVVTASGLSENAKGTFIFNGNSQQMDIYHNATSQVSNVLMPSVPGSYEYKLRFNSSDVCSGTISVVSPVTCSVENDVTVVDANTEVKFSGSINETLNQTFGLGLTNTCSFKVNGSSSGNQNVSSGDVSPTITSSTVFTFTCNNGISCSKTVFVSVPASAQTDGSGNCLNLSGLQVAGRGAVVTPVVDNCLNNCSYEIKVGGSAVVSHTTKDWNSGTAISLPSVSSEGSVNYTFSVENPYNSNPSTCAFTVTYASATEQSLTETPESYSTGVYLLTTGSLGWGPKTMHCFVNTTSSEDRIIGTLNNNCTIKIPGNNNRSNGFACPVSDNETYTFVVGSGVPTDLTCGLAN